MVGINELMNLLWLDLLIDFEGIVKINSKVLLNSVGFWVEEFVNWYIIICIWKWLKRKMFVVNIDMIFVIG